MTGAERGRLRFSERDMKLFQYLFENRIANTKQIERDVFGTTARKNIYRRLNQLKRQDLIEVIPFLAANERMQCGFSITKKCFSEYISECRDDFERVQLKSDKIQHDLALVDIKNVMTKLSMVKNYFTENQLVCGRDTEFVKGIDAHKRLRPDGIVEVVHNEKRHFLPIEYEASLKSMARCAEKITEYHTRRSILAVLFICENENVYRRFVKIEENLRKESEPKLFFAMLADVLLAKEQLPFTNIGGDKIILK